MVARATVAVLAEEPGHARPHLGDAVGFHEGAQALGEHRVGGQTAADGQVVAGLAVRADDPAEGDVVDLGVRAAGGASADRGLVLAGQVRERGVAQVALGHRADRGRGVDHLVGGDPRERAPQDHAWRVAAGFLRREAHAFQGLPDRGHVLDPDPVQLHVLTVGDVGDVTAVALAHPRDRPQLLGGHRPAVDPDPQHEELVLELLGFGAAGALARHALLALGVEPPPAEAAAQVLLADRAEPARARRCGPRARAR